MNAENHAADLKLNSLLAVVNICVMIPYVCMLFVSSANRYYQNPEELHCYESMLRSNPPRLPEVG